MGNSQFIMCVHWGATKMGGVGSPNFAIVLAVLHISHKHVQK